MELIFYTFRGPSNQYLKTPQKYAINIVRHLQGLATSTWTVLFAFVPRSVPFVCFGNSTSSQPLSLVHFSTVFTRSLRFTYISIWPYWINIHPYRVPVLFQLFIFASYIGFLKGSNSLNNQPTSAYLNSSKINVLTHFLSASNTFPRKRRCQSPIIVYY